MSLSPFRRKELATFVQDLARGDVTAPPADVPFLYADLALLLREHEAGLIPTPTTDTERLDALERDAARYRWLRNRATDQDEVACYTQEFNDWGKPYWLQRCGEALDSVIDQSLLAKEGE